MVATRPMLCKEPGGGLRPFREPNENPEGPWEFLPATVRLQRRLFRLSVSLPQNRLLPPKARFCRASTVGV